MKPNQQTVAAAATTFGAHSSNLWQRWTSGIRNEISLPSLFYFCFFLWLLCVTSFIRLIALYGICVCLRRSTAIVCMCIIHLMPEWWLIFSSERIPKQVDSFCNKVLSSGGFGFFTSFWPYFAPSLSPSCSTSPLTVTAISAILCTMYIHNANELLSFTLLFCSSFNIDGTKMNASVPERDREQKKKSRRKNKTRTKKEKTM